MSSINHTDPVVMGIDLGAGPSSTCFFKIKSEKLSILDVPPIIDTFTPGVMSQAATSTVSSNESFSTADLERVVDLLKKNKVAPNIVQSQREAHQLTVGDPFGHRWSVGEGWYQVRMERGEIAIKAVLPSEYMADITTETKRPSATTEGVRKVLQSLRGKP